MISSKECWNDRTNKIVHAKINLYVRVGLDEKLRFLKITKSPMPIIINIKN